jgi:ubiquinone/menaquinone biosynthesis C-methylase UbiE
VEKSWFPHAYRDNSAPWVTGAAGAHIVRAITEGIIDRGGRVLDIGCGYGTDIIFLALQNMKAVGLDVVHEALTKGKTLAETYCATVAWTQGDALTLPYASEAFDAIVDQGCFHHILPERRRWYAKETSRVLRAGGVYMLSGLSDRIPPGPGPWRLSSRDILETFLPHLECEELFRFQYPAQGFEWQWWTLWKKP